MSDKLLWTLVGIVVVIILIIWGIFAFRKEPEPTSETPTFTVGEPATVETTSIEDVKFPDVGK